MGSCPQLSSPMDYHQLLFLLVCVGTGAAKMLLVETEDTKLRHFSPQFIGQEGKKDAVREAGGDYSGGEGGRERNKGEKGEVGSEEREREIGGGRGGFGGTGRGNGERGADGKREDGESG